MAKVDADNDSNDEFQVWDSGDNVKFRVKESGDVQVLGDLWLSEGIHDGSGLGSSGQVLTSTGTAVSWGSLPRTWDVDSIYSSLIETVYVSDKLWAQELITDSIEALWNTIWIRDSIIVEGSGLFCGTTNDTLLYVTNTVGSGKLVSQYINATNNSTDITDWALGLRVNAFSAGNIATGISSGAESFIDDARGGEFFATHHGAALANGIQANGFNDGTGDAIGTFTEGNCASDNATGSAYGLRSRATIFEVTSTGNAYGGYFDAQNNGTGIEYGIYATVNSPTVPTNWAGYFVGNVGINGILDISQGTRILDSDGNGPSATGDVLVYDGTDFDWQAQSGSGGSARFDTLWANDLGDVSDTIYALDNFFINGELIVDSIQALGNIIDMDDTVNVIGAVSLGGDSTFRDDWEPLNVITVGGDNADFTTIEDAVNALSGAPTLIDVAPGIYTPAIPILIPSGVHLRGSGKDCTTILGPITVSGELSRVTLREGLIVLEDADVDYCNMMFDINAVASRITNCEIIGYDNQFTLSDTGIVSNCKIVMNIECSGTRISVSYTHLRAHET